MIKFTFKTIFSILISLFFLITSFFNIIFLEDFYQYEFIKSSISDEVKIENNELGSIYSSLTDYVKGEKKTIQIKANINGKTDYVFNEREIIHMEDVKKLYDLLNFIYKIIIVLIILFFTISYLKKMEILYLISSQFYITLLIFIGLMFIVLNNFTDNFIAFHEMLFSNDLWLLDPATDRMIVLLPEIVFKDMGVFSFICYFLMSFLCAVFGRLVMKLRK